MRNKTILNRIAAIGGAACLALAVLVSPVATVSVQAAPSNNGENSPQMDIIEWRYKIANGNLYRRLYNYSIGEWVGQWEYVCPAHVI